MKARYEDLRARKGSQSFLAYQFAVPRFQFHWHFHPEYELTLITSGKGKRMVGDSYEDFHEHDLVLIGPQVPHTWVSDKSIKTKPSAAVIQFTEDFIESLTNYPECTSIRTLLTRSQKGLRFSVTGNDPILESIRKLSQKKGIERITGLLTILEWLSRQKSIILASDAFRPPRGTENERRINKICQYIEEDTRDANIRKCFLQVLQATNGQDLFRLREHHPRQ
jgi:hypothetical protein